MKICLEDILNKQSKIIVVSLNTKITLSILALIFMVSLPTTAFATHIFEDSTAFGQYLDVAQLGAEKYPIVIDENEFVIYYGWGGSLEPDIEELKELDYPTVSSMAINQERKSLEVNFEQVPDKTVMWIRLPFELISAEGAKFQLLIDGQETGYDLTKFPNDYAVGMILPEGTQNLEIIGTTVIPEFGAFSITILAISLVGIIYFARTKTKFSLPF